MLMTQEQSPAAAADLDLIRDGHCGFKLGEITILDETKLSFIYQGYILTFFTFLNHQT